MKKTILLVEDSKVQKLVGERILDRAGYLVLLASDGEEGLRLARECGPELVLLDLRLPGIEGEEVLLDLKHHPLTQQIPVIIVSDLAPSNSASLKEAGAKLKSGLEDLKSVGKADPAQVIIAFNVECLPK